jgi:hypothetical protein
MSTFDKNKLNTGTNLTEKTMSKAEETELRKYFIRALLYVSGVAVSIMLSVGGFLYRRMDEQISEIKAYRVEDMRENRQIVVDYSNRLTRLETDVQIIREWQKEMQETVKESRSNQREILEAIKQTRGEK